MRNLREEGGASPLLGFIVATVVFTASFYYVVDTAVRRDQDTTHADNVSVQDTAQSLADVIFQKGAGWYATPVCLASGAVDSTKFQPEAVGSSGRMGLGDEGCGKSGSEARAVNNLSFEKFQNLYGSKLTADGSNVKVDYAEARKSLGLDGRQIDFHLRSWPVLLSTREVLKTGQKDPYMKVLYIGDYEANNGQGQVRLVQHTKGFVSSADNVTVWVRVVNNGTTSTVFTVDFNVPVYSSYTVSGHTPVLAPGAAYNVTLNLNKSSDWTWADGANKYVSYEIRDKQGGLGNGQVSLAAISMSHASTRKSLFAFSDAPTFKITGGGNVNVKFHYLEKEGDGDESNFNDWTFKLYDPSDALQQTDVLPNDKKGFKTRTVSAEGAWKARLFNDAISFEWDRDVLNVVSTEPAAFTPGAATTYAPTSAAVDEVRYIEALIENFDNRSYSTTYGSAAIPYAAGGDVFPDDSDALKNDLEALLEDDLGNAWTGEYTTIMVGSNVEQQGFNPDAVKGLIKNWEYAGGTLIVFGSDDQRTAWLEPIFKAKLDPSSGGLYTPDLEHPALNVPNDLDYAGYITDSTWEYNGADGDSFQHIVQQGDGDALAIAKPGVFGSGKVLLTGWRPSALTADQATACPNPLPTGDGASTLQCQPLFLIQNLVTLSYRELYLDYGPAIPTGVAVGAQLRIGSMYHTELRQLVPLTLQVFAFGGGS